MTALRTAISGIAFILIMLGGCGIVDELGNLQPAGLAMALTGAVIMIIQNRRH